MWAATVAALLVRTHRHEQRIDRLVKYALDSRAPHPDTAALIVLVENLCQRVQAPAQAVIDHSTQMATLPPLPLAVLDGDDDAHWQALEDKDRLAERVMAEEIEALAAAASGG